VPDSLMTYYPETIRFDPDLTTKTGRYKSVEEIFAKAAEGLRKPDRLSVTEVAEKYVKIRRIGSRSGSWSREATPYMVEPQDSLSSRNLSAVIFCGPAQSGKTESLILNYIAYSVLQDPMDMIIFNPTQQNARDFSLRRVDRLNFNSPAVRDRLIHSKAGDNKHVKVYTSGMILSLSWPTVSELAGKPVGRIAITDYDRMDDDIGTEGSPFDLAYMRTTTFGSLRMVVAESSPSRPVEDPRWISATPHEAPPTKGILSLYNRGDRRRWYWPHLKCGEFFEGNFKMLKWEERENSLDAADTVHMICPHCSGIILPAERPAMQQYGLWLRDGESLNEIGEVVGDAGRNHIASFWLNGVAAGFQSWQELVVKCINARREFETTGSEEALRQFSNNDLGEPYRSKTEELIRLPEVIQSRAEPLGEGVVPENVRFLVAAVDVQKGSFVVQVHGISPGTPYDVTIIDRFSLFKPRRYDSDGDPLPLRPATYLDDWELIVEEVMAKTYRVGDGTGRHMMVKLTICDSGGYSAHRGEGVTTMAYEFYRSLRKRGIAGRFHLVRGEFRPNIPRAYIDYPDQRRKDKLAAARGDVPVLFLNSNVLKDGLSSRLESITPGKGMIRFPDWLKGWFYRELCAERRTEKGWQNVAGGRNEAWDLLYYTLGACASQLLQAERIDWNSPPSWAAEWNQNPLVVKPSGDSSVLKELDSVLYDFASLGKTLA
jgi:phage terminase large subunit GpA-like protein